MANTTSNNLSVRQMARLLKKFHVADGDIIALKSQTDVANKQTIDEIAYALDRLDLHKCIVVVVDDFSDMTVLNETEMNSRGWYRLKSIAKVLKFPDRNDKQ